jgi:hypothetical protein
VSRIAAIEFAEMSAPLLRLTESKYLFDQFKRSQNTDINYGLFLLTVYFDSLLFCFVSIEEMVDVATRDKLRSIQSFIFFKALRNISTHHSVLSGLKGKFTAPISRIVSIGIGCEVDFSEQFFVTPERLREVFDAILKERPREKRTIEGARNYLADLEAKGGHIMLVDLIQTAITDIEPHIV